MVLRIRGTVLYNISWQCLLMCTVNKFPAAYRMSHNSLPSFFFRILASSVLTFDLSLTILTFTPIVPLFHFSFYIIFQVIFFPFKFTLCFVLF